MKRFSGSPIGGIVGSLVPVVLSAVTPLGAQVPDSLAGPDSLAPPTLFGADTLAVRDTLDAALPPAIVDDLLALTHGTPDTPYGMGLVRTGLVEADIAHAFVRIAGRDTTDLYRMRANMVHVVHAIDPEAVATPGRGLGYGLKRSAEGVLATIDRAATTPGASETLLFHAPYVRDAAEGALRRADDALDLARRVQAADDTETALELLEALAETVRAMGYGSDGDRDGRIGNTADEAGLAQAKYHLELVRRVENLPPVPPRPDDLPIPEVPSMPEREGR